MTENNALENFINRNKLYIFGDVFTDKLFRDVCIVPRNGKDDDRCFTFPLWNNDVVTIYETMTDTTKHGDIYTAVVGGGAIVYADYNFDALVQYVSENTACLDLEETESLYVGNLQ